MILTQTKALFVDAYRQLNAKKLFWLTLGLNLLVVVLFAALGINDKGVTILHWQFDTAPFDTGNVSRELFYKLQFTEWGIPIWLSWATIILALISTAGIIPDLVSGGTIEPVLSKPIGRTRLFLTKFFTGLLFVTLQVTIFSIGCMLVIGIRAGAWEPKLLLAIPIVLAVFSYLFAFCAFVGLITRSTIAALLLTILFWFAIWIVNVGDAMMIAQREGSILKVEDRQIDVERQREFAQKRLEQLEEEGKPIPSSEGLDTSDGFEPDLEAVNPTLRMSKNRLKESEAAAETWTAWASRVVLLKTLLPKTQETVGLLERNLITQKEIATLMGMNDRQAEMMVNDETPAFADPRAAERATKVLQSRSIPWILGTSFIYEALLLLISCIIFVRRDF
ncbi:MAG: ABC transporter permease [Phycisphaerales bacterium]|nr:ABC transporter permease [Phycisphaerales bacterium]